MKGIVAVDPPDTAATVGPALRRGPHPSPAGWAAIARELHELGYSAGAIGKAFLVLETGGSSRDARAALESYVEPAELVDVLAPAVTGEQTAAGAKRASESAAAGTIDTGATYPTPANPSTLEPAP